MKTGLQLALSAGLLSSSGFGQDDLQPSGAPLEVIATAHIEQFCQSDAGLQFLTNPAIRLERTSFAGPYHSRIVVTQSEDGVVVRLYPTAEIVEAEQAVSLLSMFFIMSTGASCPEDEGVLPVLETGVAGLSIQNDEDGLPDFIFGN